MNPILLLILDGWGIGKSNLGNPISQAPTPTFNWFKKFFPFLSLQASGISIGLDWGKPGTSEIGHLTLGMGKITYQNNPRITMAIREGSFSENSTLFQIKNQVKNQNSKLHLIGMISNAKTNASPEHLEAILSFCAEQKIEKVLLHLILDGKETPPKEGLKNVEKIFELSQALKVGRIASLAGRYYAMDTNEFWERTQAYFEVVVNGKKIMPDWQSCLEQTYGRNISEEFSEPTLIGKIEEKDSLTISDNDAVLFFNFREESLRQISKSLCPEDFSYFERRLPQNIFLTSLVEIPGSPSVKPMFRSPKFENSLSHVLAENGKRQLKITESSKEKLLTYYFKAMKEDTLPNELKIIIPSNKIDKDFHLQTDQIAMRAISAIEERIYDFILVNITSADFVGHQGNFEAGKQVAVYLDSVLNKIAAAILKANGTMIVTADHGNLESMIEPATGKIDTYHNDNPVPFHLIDKRFYREREPGEIAENERNIKGSLADVSPTILHLLSIEKPESMSGISLIPYCQ